MARALWQGSLTFGLVSIPVEVHRAIREHQPHFRMLHKKDLSPVRMDRVCIREGHPVAWEDLVKGYEYEKGRFVVVTKEDFRAAALEKTKAIEIMSFVDPKEIDDRYFETPYYLVPGKNGDHAYALLREAIKASGRIGIGKFILRERQHLAAVEVIDEALVLSVMRFADELADTSGLRFPTAGKPGKQELKMAQMLVENLAASWEPAKYTDQYTENVMRIIEGKLKGKKDVHLEEDTTRRPAKVVDLMERLRLSLEQTGKGRRATSERSPKKAGAKNGRARPIRGTHVA
jgi:DNA end-binding protein Ku